MKKKIVCGVIITAFIASGGIAAFKYTRNTPEISVDFSEIYLGEDKLVEKADAIVLGKLVSKIDSKTETIPAKDEKTANIVWTYSTYNLKVNEAMSGKVPQNIELVFAGDKLKDIELNTDYILFLEKDQLGENKFHLLSYSEGVFEVQGKTKEMNVMANDNLLFVNKKTDAKFSKNSLIKKINELNK